MKLFAPNILLGTPDEHNNQEQYEVFNERKLILKRVYYKVIFNKNFEK